MSTKNTTPAAPKGTEVVSNNAMEIVDNTDVTVTEVETVESESYELVSGLTQVNYK
jgi:hypothetical protein